MKIRICRFLILFVFLLSACNPAPTPEVNPLPVSVTAVVAAEPTLVAPTSMPPTQWATPIHRQRPTEPADPHRAKDLLSTLNAPSPTPGPTSTPTRVPEPTATATLDCSISCMSLETLETPVWNPYFGEPYSLPLSDARWSPTANEIAGLYYPSGDPFESASLAVSRAPDFAQQVVENIYHEYDTPGFTWSPDGRRIVFALPTEFDESIPWIVDHNGQNARPLPHAGGDEFILRMTLFGGWMDERKLIITGWGGGGSHDVHVVDVWTGETLAQGFFPGGVYTPNAHYIPALWYSSTPMRLFVIANQTQPEKTQVKANDYPEYSRAYPEPYESENGLIDRVFVTWVPGKDEMILFQFLQDWNSYDPSGLDFLQIDLRSWNLGTDETRVLAPNGIDAQFSPDGSTLAVTTLGKNTLDGNGHFLMDAPPPKADNRQPYMYLMDANSQKVYLQVPVVFSHLDWLTTFPESNIRAPHAEASFSPDSRYLAFLTPGELTLNEAGAPENMGTIRGEKVMLNLLDLASRRLIFSVPTPKLGSWAPKSDKFVYQGEDGNWYLFDLRQGDFLAITHAGGETFSKPSWSFSGSYLSFPTRWIRCDQPGSTVIITMPER